jgi:hypothetical protein
MLELIGEAFQEVSKIVKEMVERIVRLELQMALIQSDLVNESEAVTELQRVQYNVMEAIHKVSEGSITISELKY